MSNPILDAMGIHVDGCDCWKDIEGESGYDAPACMRARASAAAALRKGMSCDEEFMSKLRSAGTKP